MDSAHEEPELPFAIQDLVQRLEGQGKPVRNLPDLCGPEFRGFFPERASRSRITGWRSQVRLRVLEAIGNCTFELLCVSFCGGDISRLTASEWEIVFRGFRSSTVLLEIYLEGLRGLDAEVENWCLQLGRILNSSSVTALDITGRLSARCFLNLASGMRGNCESKLATLVLCNAWKDSSAVKHVADMINSAPLLETLKLFELKDMEDEAVGILSQALIQISSLKELELMEVKWGAPLLLKALAGDDRNRSIERLRLSYVDGLGDCLGEILISNPSLKKVALRGVARSYMSPEEWRQLGEVIRDNAIATTIVVTFLVNIFEWKSIEALAQVKDPTVELELIIVIGREDDEMFSLKLLGSVLRGEIKSLKFLIIGDYFLYRKIITFSILPKNGKTGETSVQKRLELSVRSKDLSKGVWEDLLQCMRGNHLTHLDLSHSQLDEEAFKDMMGVLQVNLALQEINVSRT